MAQLEAGMAAVHGRKGSAVAKDLRFGG